jgi:hypothetical protein
MPRAAVAEHHRIMATRDRMTGGVGRLPSRGSRSAVARLRAWRDQPRLDAALARGTEPWASDELYARAVRLTSREERRSLARALDELVARAHAGRQGRPYRRLRGRRPSTPLPTLRRAAVLSHGDALTELAARVGGPVPVPAAVVARLMLLCCEGSSPVFAGGRPVDELDTILNECLEALDRSAEPPQSESSDSDTRRS